MNTIDKKIIDNIKKLGIDMIDEAKSGHPGIVLSAAPIIYTLYSRHLKVNPKDDKWLNRDRFVMSAGHGSALLYATLYMAGFEIDLNELKRFRQIGSIVPGHPELNVTPGIDLSTGPLGQGFASAVGMAIAEKYLKTNYNIPKKYNIIDHNIYVLCGDGDLMEGISYEATSIAGNLKLNNLIVLYDSNNTTLDGKINMTFNENIEKRFTSQNWNYILVKDGENIDQIDKAIIKAKKSDKPTLIEVKTILGKGSLLEGTNKVHGSPLSIDDLKQLNQKLGMRDVKFTPSQDAVEYFRETIKKRVAFEYDKWNDLYKEFIDNSSEDVKRDFNILNNKTSIDTSILNKFTKEMINESLRESNGKVLNELCGSSKLIIGGSADVASSTKTYIKNGKDFSRYNYSGQNLWFGIREHSMGAILNGISTYNIKTFGSTFLSFSDYLKPAIRMSALMNLPVTYIFTHDSIDIGEDGPTHQPIEQLTMLNSIPELDVYMPCDIKEIVGCYELIYENNNPSVLVLGRNNVESLRNSNHKKIKYGGYIVKHEKNDLNAIFISNGSNMNMTLELASYFEEKGYGIRVVSMPSINLFLKQDENYKNDIINYNSKIIFIEPNNMFELLNEFSNNCYTVFENKFGTSAKKNDVLDYMKFSNEELKGKITYILENLKD